MNARTIMCVGRRCLVVTTDNQQVQMEIRLGPTRHLATLVLEPAEAVALVGVLAAALVDVQGQES